MEHSFRCLRAFLLSVYKLKSSLRTEHFLLWYHICNQPLLSLVGGRRRYSRAGAKGFNANRRRSRAVLYHLSGHLQKQGKGKRKLHKVSQG